MYGLCTEGGGNQRGESRLLLRLIPPDDIRNTTAIAKKLRCSVVILVEEHFEFAIRAAHTVKISAAGAQCIERVPREFRHTTAIVNTA